MTATKHNGMAYEASEIFRAALNAMDKKLAEITIENVIDIVGALSGEYLASFDLPAESLDRISEHVERFPFIVGKITQVLPTYKDGLVYTIWQARLVYKVLREEVESHTEPF